MTKILISRNALRRRVQRALAKSGLALHGRRGRAEPLDGRFFIIGNQDQVVEQAVDLEAKARELGLIKPFEVYNS